MKKEHVIALSLVVLIAFFSYLIISSSFAEFKYEFEQEGVQFVSDYKHPGEFFKEAAEKDFFVVSPQFTETGSTSFMAESLSMFNSVLISNAKSVKTVARVVGPEKELLYCLTNDGNVLENRRVESQACLPMLEPKEGEVVVFVELPSQSIPKPQVEVMQGKIILRPRDFSQVSGLSFIVLKTMFPNAKEVIDRINVIIGNVST